MHYIRLLRPARLDATGRGAPHISLLFTVTTDLGDSFLHPDAPVDLLVAAASGAAGEPFARKTVRWNPGLRLLPVLLPVPPHMRRGDAACVVKIHPAAQQQPFGVVRHSDVLPWTVDSRSSASRGLIVPANVEMVGGVGSPVSLRALQLRTGPEPRDPLMDVYFEEDIGESIARHIWDAGVVTACYLADVCLAQKQIRDVLPVKKDSFCVLELGSGVGILGITLACIIGMAAGMMPPESVVLLTDLPEAEERARSNISRASAALAQQDQGASTVELQYENLDWDEGRLGRFGPLVSARVWDLVILSDCTYNVDSLPALVGTLSALHTANLQHPGITEDAKTSVLLATKPRHFSEQALFGLLEADDWQHRVIKSIPLPKLGEEDEVVDIYMLEKGTGIS
ncbi:putative methyltransferase-domain-containing protein [Hypoxylon cercidicola]|nr:putative methyltransferase-domain-containing protein [Hypoxylon cercidicola]